MRTDRYRKSIYEEFAKEARAEGLEWIVLHGIEGYPESIGRDLDSYCIDTQTIFRACELFENVAKANEDTLYVIYPSPLWGKRVLAVSKNYEVAELHILYRINSGIINFVPNMKNIKFIGDFPYEEQAMEFKSVVMSLLGNNKKVISRMEENGVPTYAKVLQVAYRHLKQNGAISKSDKIKIYLKYMGSLFSAIDSLKYSLVVKKERIHYATTPIIEFVNYNSEVYERLKTIIFEVFTDYRCGDEMSMEKMIRCCSRQEFIYITMPRPDLGNQHLVIDLNDIDAATKQIVDEFNKFNNNNKLSIFKYK